MLDLNVHASGPLFDGRLRHAVAVGVEAAKREVSQQGVNDVRNELGQVLRHPTGFYTGHITTERRRDDLIVTDGGVIYGAWLAGVSQRNQATRFKGYTHWRRAAQRLQQQAYAIADRVIGQHVGRAS